jgi:hypothetical protein
LFSYSLGLLSCSFVYSVFAHYWLCPDTLPLAQCYTSDGQTAYAELVWSAGSQYVVSRGKEEAYRVESLNANLWYLSGALRPAQPLF